MNADRTDELIAKAIAGLPYRKAPAGFRARVMARLEAAPEPAWEVATVKAAGFATAAWTAFVGALSAGPVYAFLSETAALLSSPGGIEQGLKLAGAFGALMLVKVSASFSFASDLGHAAVSWLPPFYEIAVAALVCGGVIKAVSGGRSAVQKV